MKNTMKIYYDDNTIDVLDKFDDLLNEVGYELEDHTEEGKDFIEYGIKEIKGSDE